MSYGYSNQRFSNRNNERTYRKKAHLCTHHALVYADVEKGKNWAGLDIRYKRCPDCGTIIYL